MANGAQSISVLLCVSLVFSSLGLDGCKKEAAPTGTTASSGATAPVATYAAPTPDQLYQLVAPIALFPDSLLAQVLAASTFPDQVTAAWNYLQQNQGLKGPQLMQSVDGQSWDNSVKGLTQFPDVLQQMAGSLSWTSSLGDAYFNSPQTERDERCAGDAPARVPGGEPEEHPPSRTCRSRTRLPLPRRCNPLPRCSR